MKRVKIAAVVLTLSLAFSLFSFFTIKNDCLRLTTQAKEMIAIVENEKTKQLQAKAKQIKDLWQKERTAFSLLTTHQHFDALEESIDKLYRAAQKKQVPVIRTCCEELIFEAAHIINITSPRAENVL